MKSKFLKAISLILACITLLTTALVGCSPKEDGESDTKAEETTKETNKETTAPETSEESTTEEIPEVPVNNFDTYKSNILNTTSHNTMIIAEGGKAITKTYRGVFKVQEYGTFDYKFFITNGIDSCSSGYTTNVSMPIKAYKILEASIMKTKERTGRKGLSDPVSVTFDGEKSKTVKPNEEFWTDTVEFTVNEGEYLIFQWTVQYERIPATIVASTFFAYEEKQLSNKTVFASTWSIPMPDLVACNRKDTTSVGFIGDSITEGTGSGDRRYEFWVAQIAERIGTGYSVWNLGLDSARARDAVKAKHWLNKAKENDILCICIGINDVCIGTDEGQKTAKQIFGDIKTIAETCNEAGSDIILFTIPPFPGVNSKKWTDTNDMIKAYAKEKGFKLFDFAKVLGNPDKPWLPMPKDPANPNGTLLYGDHPNAAGCLKVAEEFMKQGILEPKN